MIVFPQDAKRYRKAHMFPTVPLALALAKCMLLHVGVEAMADKKFTLPYPNDQK